MTTAAIPGAGLTYTDLCNTSSNSEERAAWRALATLADVMGVETVKAVIGGRSKTVDELIEDLTPVIPDGYDLLAAARAAQSLNPELPARAERYDVYRILARADDDLVSDNTLVSTADDYETARATKDRLVDHDPIGIYAIVHVQTTTQTTIQPANYTPRI